MLELLAFIILIAIFFGISLSAALHGALIFLAVVFVIACIATIAAPYISALSGGFVPSGTPKPATKPSKARVQKPHNLIVMDIVFFIVTYLISAIVLMIMGISENPNIPIIVKLLLPSLPAVVFYIVILCKKHIKKHAKR